jgi:hypothetical protein
MITSHGNQLSNELIHGVVNTSTYLVLGGWLAPDCFLYRRRAWVQALPWFEICALGQQTGFFRQVRELKIQRKNPGSALQNQARHITIERGPL